MQGLPTPDHSPASRARSLLAEGELLMAPGCGDALSARLIETEGFPLVYVSGGWTAGAKGLLDVGLVTLTEMVENAKYISQSVTTPVLADADTGFGGVVSVRRCVAEFELAGVAGIQIEDQALPKTCGLMDRKNIVSTRGMENKIRAAVSARSDPAFLIIARTDALESEGTAAVIDRGEHYFDAGADILFVEGFRSESDIHAVGQAFPDRDLLFNRTPAGYAPPVPLETLQEWGYKLIVFPVHLILGALYAQRELLREIRATGNCAAFDEKLLTIDGFFELLGKSAMEELDRQQAEG